MTPTQVFYLLLIPLGLIGIAQAIYWVVFLQANILGSALWAAVSVGIAYIGYTTPDEDRPSIKDAIHYLTQPQNKPTT